MGRIRSLSKIARSGQVRIANLLARRSCFEDLAIVIRERTGRQEIEANAKTAMIEIAARSSNIAIQDLVHFILWSLPTKSIMARIPAFGRYLVRSRISNDENPYGRQYTRIRFR